jgi:hypothetical protein
MSRVTWVAEGDFDVAIGMVLDAKPDTDIVMQDGLSLSS